jgi:hypothetical protein
MNEEISEELEEIASRLTSHRGNAEEQNYSGSTGDVVTRLEKIGIHTHKAKVAEVADLLFGDDVRSRQVPIDAMTGNPKFLPSFFFCA